MRRILTALVTGFVLVVSSPVCAEENEPFIVAEQLQKLAAEYPIAERLNIKWANASLEDVGRYLGFLAAINQVAFTIAAKNARNEPTDLDFRAALAAACLFPNKPPLMEKYWPAMYPAFYSYKTREALSGAVGPVAISLPKALEADPTLANQEAIFPTNEDDYSTQVLDLRGLPSDR